MSHTVHFNTYFIDKYYENLSYLKYFKISLIPVIVTFMVEIHTTAKQ